MNRSMFTCLTLPLALALSGCTTDDGTTTDTDVVDSNETSGITTMPTTSPPTTDDPATDTDTDTDTASGDGDGDSGGDGDGEAETGPDCGSVSIVPEYVPPNVMLVVDASGSMVAQSWDHDLDPNTDDITRWSSLYGVVDSVMSNFSATMYSGVQRFPSEAACDPDPCYNITSCDVEPNPEVSIALDNGDAILAAIPGANADGTSIEGGTPAAEGIRSAVNHLMGQQQGSGNYILLVTDGAANCDTQLPFPDYIEFYDETLPTTVEEAYQDQGITTFVVGIDIVDMLVGDGVDGSPEANPFERLNDVAVAGGAPKNGGMDDEKFFNSTNQDELLTALDLILDEVTDCTIDLTMTEEGPPDPAQIPYVSFTSDGVEVPYVEDCENEDGWTWIEQGLILTFCGSYCEDFKQGTAVFDGEYGCPPAG